jgi:HEAT repeat protein
MRGSDTPLPHYALRTRVFFMSTPHALLHFLSHAFVLTLERDSGDPALLQALGDVRDAHADVGWMVLRVDPLAFRAGEVVVRAEQGYVGKLRDALEEAGILEIRLHHVVEPEVLDNFLRRLHPSNGPEVSLPSARFRGLESEIGLSFQKSLVVPAGMSGSIQKLFGFHEPLAPELPPVADAQPLADSDSAADAQPVADARIAPDGDSAADARPVADDRTAPDGDSAADAQPVADARTIPDHHPAGDARPMDAVPADVALWPLPPVSPALEEEVWALLQDMGPSRGGRLSRLRESLVPLQEARDQAALAEVVQFLIEASGETAENEDVVELARDLTTPAVASHLVARLGTERDEAERGRLIRDLIRLGREAALALADALGEARDRFQRRSFVDALAAMGPLGMEMAHGMVLDPRWFVVRNGVAILGDIGGEAVVGAITAALAHTDHRVRRESVLSLAKLGGDDAVQLLLGMMDDPEPDVRGAACRALGALKSDKALMPLLTLLESEKDEDVQVECLRALGHLGDPGAVPLVEKKAVGGLFSRVPREVRIAAYRALAGIGTPKAKALLEKAAEGSDVGIRTVVRALLSQE